MGKTVLVCGGRDYADRDFMREVLTSARDEGFDQLIHGGASGADELARQVGFSLGFRVVCYSADWVKDGRAAGPIRNQRMLDHGKPDLVIAFPGGRGTADMVRRAKAAGVRVIDLADGPDTVEDPPSACGLEYASVMSSIPPQYGWWCKKCGKGTGTSSPFPRPDCLKGDGDE